MIEIIVKDIKVVIYFIMLLRWSEQTDYVKAGHKNIKFSNVSAETLILAIPKFRDSKTRDYKRFP
jgi:hypothetical protein